MSIQVRKPKNPRGNLSVYRKTYQRTQEVRGVHVPGHVAVNYVGKMPRFGTIEKLKYAKSKEGQTPASLSAGELKVLQQFLDGDAKNWFSSWPKDLVTEIETAVRAEFMDSVEPQSHLDVAASTLRGAAMDIENLAKVLRAEGQDLAPKWIRNSKDTAAPDQNGLTQLKARANEVRQAFAEFEDALRAAALIVKHDRKTKKGGAQ